jgi:hypothetical protein
MRFCTGRAFAGIWSGLSGYKRLTFYFDLSM